MGISIIDNFDYRAGKPNFTRDLFENIEEMVAFPEMYLPTVFECNIKSGDRYRYNVNNEIDPILGKWRLVTGSGGPANGYTKDEINAKMNLKLDKPEIEGTEGQFLSLDVDGKTVFVDLPQYDDTELKELIQDIQLGNLSYEIVDSLPDSTLQTVDPNMLYLVKTDSNIVNPFMFIDGEFKSIGSASGGAIGGVVESNNVLYSNTALDTVTNAKEALDAIIAKVYYVAPSIPSFTCNPSRTSYELGEKVSSITFNWAYNKDIASQALTGCTLADNTVREAVYDVELTSNKTFTLSCSDGQNNASSSKSFTFSSKVHSGSASIPDTYDSAFILGLSGTLKGNKSGTYTVNVGANQYFYIAMPTSYNSADTLVGKIGGFSTTFGKVAQLSHTNASGYTCDYNIYKSTNANLGNVSFVV